MNLDIDFIQDKKVNGGCSLRRPDFLFEMFTHTNKYDDENKFTTCEIAYSI